MLQKIKTAARMPRQKVRQLEHLAFKWKYSESPEPILSSFLQEQPHLEERIRRYYKLYITTFSNPVMAISLELACLLYYLCEQLNTQVMVDLGSGFSSFVFRMYQREVNPQAQVFSVDHDPEWLERTSDFLTQSNVDSGNLWLWEDFRRHKPAISADLILNDLGGGATSRIPALTELLHNASPGTMLLLDDVHKKKLRPHAIDFIKKNKLRYIDLAPYTTDELGRYQWAICGFTDDQLHRRRSN